MALTGIKDLDLEILMNLPDRDLLNYCSTNKDIYNMCNNEMFWRKRYIKRFGDMAAQYKPRERKWKNHYMQTVIDLDRFSTDPWEFLKYIDWSPKGAEFSYFKGVKNPRYEEQKFERSLVGRYPFLEAPEWVMTNFFLLEIPRFQTNGKQYSKITPDKLFELLAKDITPNSQVNGHGIYKNKSDFSY